MEGIVYELEREALDENVSVESLLRKAYLVARKLKLSDFEEWINNEQNGYHGEVLDYRMDLCQYFGHKKLNFSPSITYAERMISYAARASSSTCCGVL